MVAPSLASDARLSSGVRWLWLLAWLAGGALPSIAFFVWIERNLALPNSWNPFLWPWVDLTAWVGPDSWILGSVWNGALFAVFGLAHSVLAQPRVREVLTRVVPHQAIRTFYVMVSGSLLLGVMGLWQHSGRVVWALSLPQSQTYILSAALFWGFMGGTAWALRKFDGLEFIGVWQLFQKATTVRASWTPSGNLPLHQEGLYGWVRHPIYLFTLAAMLVTPVMSWDRLWLFLLNALYLVFAIPVEERKLIQIWGDRYMAYQKRVPAVLPRFWRRS